LVKPENKARMSGLIDTIMLCHQMRISMYGEEGFVKGKWANDISSLKPANRADALKMFAESVALEGNNTDDAIPTYYMKAAEKEFEKNRLSFDSLVMIYDQMGEIVKFNIAKFNKDTNSIKFKNWQTAEDNINKIMLPYLDCDKIEALKRKEMAANLKDAEKLEKILKLLEIRNCDDKDFYLEVSEALYKAKPSPESAYALAKAFKGKGQLSKAYNYFEKSADGLSSADDKAEAYYNLALLSLNNKQMSTSRNYARKALEINPNMGKAYIIIGDAYASSSAACTEDKLGGKSVFWAAVDKYYKAKQVDPSVAETANEKINKFSAYFPDQETAFFNGINDGTSFSVGCWIGESTTVRTKK
jgi:tetratricopeptide (TPR) repeat protein